MCLVFPRLSGFRTRMSNFQRYSAEDLFVGLFLSIASGVRPLAFNVPINWY